MCNLWMQPPGKISSYLTSIKSGKTLLLLQEDKTTEGIGEIIVGNPYHTSLHINNTLLHASQIFGWRAGEGPGKNNQGFQLRALSMGKIIGLQLM